MRNIKAILLFLIIGFSFINIALAETGTVTVSDNIKNSNYTGTSTGTTTNKLFSHIYYDDTDFIGINYLYVYTYISGTATFTYLHPAESTTFTCNSGGSCSGIFWYSSDLQQFGWDFSASSVFTSSSINLTYSNPSIFSNITALTAIQRNTVSPITTNKPVWFGSGADYVVGGAGVTYAWLTSNVYVTTTNDYEVTYPLPNKFNINVTKHDIATKDSVHGLNSIYMSMEGAVNKNNFQFFGDYSDGLYLNVSLTNGAHTDILINSSGIPISSTAVTITTDKASYQRADPITITVNNPSASKVFVTGYGPTGIMTDILWNGEVAAGTNKTWNKIIKDDYPLGDYSISAATTDSYAPIVAITYFTIALPTNISNKLGLLWDQATYNIGNTGIINSQSNFNTTTMIITSPGGHTQTFNFAANATNSTGITLDEPGTWQAKLTDNGNASNYLISSTYVWPLAPTDNQSFQSCKQQKTYVCFDQHTYRQGDKFLLEFKLTPQITDIASLYPYIEIEAPDGKIVINRSVNGTYQQNTANYVGSLSGTFSTTATLGTYWARIQNKNILGTTETRAEGYTALLQGNSTVIPTPTTGTPGMSNQAANLLNVFTYMAFYGLAIFLGIFYGAIKLMTAHGAQANGQALVIIMAVVATMEALIGLFDPFKLYIIVITWIFAAIYFRQNRTAATGEQ